MKKINSFYDNRIVYKPWGYEYVVYSSSNRLAITFLKINYGHKTSLHCHPKKKTGFIILSGKALVQIGIYKENSKSYGSLSRLVFRPGLFHSIKANSKQGICALEFETPFKKNDLVRFKDDYGRQQKSYEGEKFTKIDKYFHQKNQYLLIQSYPAKRHNLVCSQLQKILKLWLKFYYMIHNFLLSQTLLLNHFLLK